MKNHLEVSAYKYLNKEDAVNAVDTIINNRIKKIKEIREPYRKLVDEIQKLYDEKESVLLNINQTRIDKTSDNAEVVKEAETKLVRFNLKLDELNSKIQPLKTMVETARKAKNKAIRKYGIKAWQCLPVVCIGKKGSNYIFKSE